MANIIFTKKSLSSSIEDTVPVNSKMPADTYSITTIDHDKLKNRDLADQHPIEAITGLTDAFSNVDTKITTEIDNVNESINALELADKEILGIVGELSETVDANYYDLNSKIDDLKTPATYEHVLDDSIEYSPTRIYYKRVIDASTNSVVGVWRFNNNITLPIVQPLAPGIVQTDPTQFDWVEWNLDTAVADPDYDENHFKYGPYIFNSANEKVWPFTSRICLNSWSTSVSETTQATKLLYGYFDPVPEDEENTELIDTYSEYWTAYDVEAGGWQDETYKELIIPASPNVDLAVENAFLKFLNANATKLLDYAPETKTNPFDTAVKYTYVRVDITEEEYIPNKYYYLKKLDNQDTPEADRAYFKSYPTFAEAKADFDDNTAPEGAICLVGTGQKYDVYQARYSELGSLELTNIGVIEFKDFQAEIDDLKDYVDAHVEDIEAAINETNTNLLEETERAQNVEATLQAAIDDETNTRIAEIDRVDASITATDLALNDEIQRATDAEALVQTNLNAEVIERRSEIARVAGLVNSEEARATQAEQDLQINIDNEALRAGAAEATLQGNIDNEEAVRSAADTSLANEIATINSYIQEGTSNSNQLTNVRFVNSSIATATANFLGTYDIVTDLHLPRNATHEQVIAALAEVQFSSQPTNNDYVFVEIDDAIDPEHASQFDRYKFVTLSNQQQGSWEFEYTLNNSSFTQAQWAAINSGINAAKIDTIDSNIATNASDISNLRTDLTAEASRATIAEGGLDSKIELEITNRTNDVNDEETRAVLKETQIENDLVDEAVRAIVTDTNLEVRTSALETGKVIPNKVPTQGQQVIVLSTIGIGNNVYKAEQPTVDLQYNSQSDNPQSGKAVAKAVNDMAEEIINSIITSLNTPV